MLRKAITFAALALACAGCERAAAPQAALPADLIYLNGNVHTGVAGAGPVTAVAVRDGRVLATGPDDAVLEYRGAETEVVDLAGQTMLPGFYDNHVHATAGRGLLMEWKGGLIYEVPAWIREVSDTGSLVEAIRREAARLGPGETVIGALSREVWPNQTLPDRYDLDAGSETNPVLLTRGPHTTVLNSAALAAVGITADTTFPGGGDIGHDRDGEPDGRLYDAARRLADDLLPVRSGAPIGEEQAVAELRALLGQFAASGVTSVNVASVRPHEFRYFQKLYDQYGESLPRAVLQLRLRPGFDRYDDLDESVRIAIDELESVGFVTGFGNDRLRIGAVKMSIDGGMSAPAYWSLEPYESRPDFTGVVRIPAQAFYPVAKRAHDLGWQLGIHTMGDGAVVMVVDQLERILAESPRENHRHYLHHVAVRPPQETIDKMARLGIGVASQPSFTVGLGSFAVESLAGEREATMNPTRSLLDAGVWVSWGSDGAPYGPRVTLWTGITRKGWDDRVYGPEEAVSREQAVRLHTWAPAYQTFQEHDKGTIEAGKFADFVVLGEDIFSVDEDRIRYIPIVRTIVGGRDIFVAPP